MAHALKQRLSTLRASEAWWNIGCALLVFIMSLYVMLCFIESSDFLGMGPRSPQSMIDGTAMKPHVYRQLVPLMARTVMIITPDVATAAIATELHTILWNSKFFNYMVLLRHPAGAPAELNDSHLYQLFIIVCIDYLFLIGYVLVMLLLARCMFPSSFAARLLTAILAIALLPPFCGVYGYMYDFPVLFFSALLTWMLARKQWWLYCALFALATLNKETTAYLIIVYGLYGYKVLPRLEWLHYGKIQTILFVVVKLILALSFHKNFGELLPYSDVSNKLKFVLDGYNITTVLGIIAALLLFAYGWKDKPLLLRSWMAILPVMIIVWLFFGNRYEFRVFYEIFPALILLSVHTLITVLQWDGVKNK